MGDTYQTQDRGGNAAYERYLQGMDASMRQKVALTAAHLLCAGNLADMGMGSGSGSYALAALYPDLHVTGVDVNGEMIQRARSRYVLPNLHFQQGDVAEPCFPAGSQEAILDSSVLHHVTSFNGYDRSAAARALAVQAMQLTEHGVLIVRDFVDPGPGMVWLDLPTSDGTEENVPEREDPRKCSTAALLERFAREFRLLQTSAVERGFACRVIEPVADCPLRPGFQRYELAYTHAVEFLLRKDYRRDWETEVQEEYTYATQAEFETIFQRLGLRVLASTPIRNPWIVQHRFRDKFDLWETTGRRLDDPATNYVIVGQKVAAGVGVRLAECGERPRINYLELTHYRHVETGQVYDLARRPNTTIDVLPWFQRQGEVFVLARRSYPRPILSAQPRGSISTDGSTPAAYLSEPLNVQQGDKPLGQTVEELLGEFAAIGSDNILSCEAGHTCYPSPGGLQEEIRSILVEVQPTNVQIQLANRSGFSSSGELRAIEARQALRSAQVGGLPECRLERNIYDLLLRRDLGPGPWIGANIDVPPSQQHDSVTTFSALMGRMPRRRFRRVTAADRARFLDVVCSQFDELDAVGRTVASQVLEFVIPRTLSRNSVAVAPLCRHHDEVLLGVDDDDLPAAQCFVGNSELLVAPAWRLPREVIGIRASRIWIAHRLRAEYGAVAGEMWELGGPYHPSPGVTPEVVHPLAVHVKRMEPDAARRLYWLPLREMVQRRSEVQDGHLLTLVLALPTHWDCYLLRRTDFSPFTAAESR